MNKTHVQHSVGFIQHKYLHMIQGHDPLVHQVQKPAGACNENVASFFQRLNLCRLSYTAKDGETVDLVNLAVQHYTSILIPGGRLTLTGQQKQSLNMVIRTAGDSETVLTLNNVNLKGLNETSIQLGERSRVTMILEGTNILNKDGILVPASSSLTLQGGGELRILNNRNYSVGIGSNYNDAYGTIVVDMDGSLFLQSAGDKVVCIGGGRSAGEGISLLRGSCRLEASGISVLGIGSSTGDARVDIRSAAVSALIEGNDAQGIGSISGQAEIRSEGVLDITLNSERATGIGSLSGTGRVSLEGGSVSVSVHCDVGACIGSFSGEAAVRIAGTQVSVHGEGNRVAGFGSTDGTCETRIESGDVQGDILAGKRLLLGNEQSRVIITGGNVPLFPEGSQFPVSPDGKPLCYLTPEGDHFEEDCHDSSSAWTYTADRDGEGRLGVWLPGPE